MPDVLAQFDERIALSDGRGYFAQACAAPNQDGLWEGWIEFIPADGGAAVRTARETTQPSRAAAAYWASGLTPVFLEGALNRALNPPVRKVTAAPESVFESPAPSAPAGVDPSGGQPAPAILDPYSVYRKGERLLRQELGALSAWHLANVVLGYRMSEELPTVLNSLPKAALIELIVAHARQYSESR